jgi:peptidylprolyl isomerase
MRELMFRANSTPRQARGRLRSKTLEWAGSRGGVALDTVRFVREGSQGMRRFQRATIFIVSGVALVIAAIACVPDTAAAQTAGKTMTTASGLQISDSKVGTGASPKPGQTCVMHYTGWLYENGQKGKKFDSSVDRNEPFEFPIGQRKVIAGWDEGVATMKVGGKRTLIIPPTLGYGARGAGGVIPPNATLMFDVELLDVK